MNNSIFESIFAVFDDKPPFLSILDTFWPIFGHFSYSTSINHSLTIELNNILNWITRVYFELNNILNWILGKAILNRILNESFFGKIQILNWIRLGIVHHYFKCLSSKEQILQSRTKRTEVRSTWQLTKITLTACLSCLSSLGLVICWSWTTDRTTHRCTGLVRRGTWRWRWPWWPQALRWQYDLYHHLSDSTT